MSQKIWLTLIILGLGGCRIVSEQELADLKSPPNPHMTNIEQVWQQKLVPQVIRDAHPAAELLAKLRAAPDFDTACQTFGYRSQDENPCVFFVEISGSVEKIDTTSRNGKMTILDKSGSNVVIQIGPTIRGTQLRDGFKGASYQDFNDQVLFGDYGRAINDLAVETVQKAALQNGEIRQVYGVFSTWDIPETIPEITPVQLTRLEEQQ
ncbi:Predicted periplasmic lipoprotein [Leminorella richardii]|uniref:Predicted periplasmic lipoprotein n=1 Tax=Leminorella richardii TaxID=158841 RepID=A0A2X4U4W6_9GAMM|nr:DUF2291 domain-containing protein [Leminorella richardii]SQI34836.1 Predicted periplasmic lipoprotein [Leminorella richardii]